MRRLGISIYPEHSTKEKDFAYMEKAAKLGFTRIFTCFLSVTKSKEEMIAEFKEYMDKAHELGMKVAVDTNPAVFDHLGAKADDLSVFKEIGVDIVRLDNSFGVFGDVTTTQNPYGLQIEFNGSSSSDYVELLLTKGARKDQMLICHNFYPQKYTGLGYTNFMEWSKRYHELGFTTAAFVSSNNENTYGPWPVYAGLPTVEFYRNYPIDTQARFLFATNYIDDVIIGNAYASDQELEALSKIDKDMITIKIDQEKISELEEEIIYHNIHNWRQDYNDYMVRSSMPRVKYKGRDIPVIPYREDFFHKGDVVVINNNLEHYRGELQIILKDIPNDGERNLVGRVKKEEMCILDLMDPIKKFKVIRDE